MLRILCSALVAVAAYAVAVPDCYAQSSPGGDAETGSPAVATTPESIPPSPTSDEMLPPIIVQQEEPPNLPEAPAKPKKVVSPRKPSMPRAVVATSDADDAAVPSSPLEAYPQDANPLVNPGTPSAGVAPIMGAASSPAAQTATAIDVSRLEDEPLFSVGDVLRQSPGVSVKQGNGPRDFGISIRGSNARNGFGIRNIVIFDDGFPVTQPDGLSRSDLIDPHA
jgi:iron complex outermembrane receptor protein